MRTDEPIHYYNPELPLEWLIEHCPVEEKYSRLLKIGSSEIRNDSAKVSIAVTLFDRNVNDHTGACKADQRQWKKKYYRPLLKNIDRLSDLGDVSVDLFVDPELQGMVQCIDSDRVNIHTMAMPSNGFAGGFWRFLVSDVVNRDCTLVFQDIDQTWGDCVPMLVEHCPVAPAFPDRHDKALVECETTGSSKYSSIGAGMFSCEAKQLDFSMAEVVARYWHYKTMIMHLVEPKNEFNRPMRGRHFGFGNTWNLYGSDERFLAKVIYYYLARKGALNIMLFKADFYHDAEIASRDFVHKHGGKVIYV